MYKEDAEVEEVAVGQNVGEEGRQRPEEGEEQLGHVVEVAGHSPPATGQQQALPLLPTLQCVFCSHNVGLLTPDLTLALGASYILLLLVSKVVDYDAGCTKGEDGNAQSRAQIHGLVDEVHAD